MTGSTEQLKSFFGKVVPEFCSAAQDTDPLLTLSSRTDQSVVVSWFGDDGVPYQLEASSDLTVWTDASPVITGTGNFINVTHPVAGQFRVFFRFKHPPPDTISAVFDPQTGVLTIVGGDGDNTIVVSRDPAGTLRVNDGAVPISGGVRSVHAEMLAW